MEPNLLQRVFAISSRGLTGHPVLAALASIARKLGTDDSDAEKAAFIAGAIRKLQPSEQNEVIAAIEKATA
jgi:hypothetical protein